MEKHKLTRIVAMFSGQAAARLQNRAWPLDPKMAFRLGKLFRQVRSDLEVYQEARKGLIESFADKNEKGEPIMTTEVIPDPSNPEGRPLETQRYTFETPETEKAANEAAEQLMKESTVELESVAVNWDKLPKDITPAEVDILLEIG